MVEDKGVPPDLREALDKAGLKLKDTVMMGYAELVAIEGLGERSAEWVLAYWGKESDSPAALARKEVIVGVKQFEVNRARRLAGTWRRFDYDTREAFDGAGVTDIEIAEWLLANKRAKAGMVRGVTDRDREEVVNEEWEERYQEYVKHFEAPTPNDVASLRRLAYMDMAIDKAQRKVVKLSAAGKGMEGDTKAAESLNKQITDLSKEARELQKMMGIDRVKREEVQVEDPLTVYTEGMKDAQWLLENEIQEVVHRCKDKKIVPIMAIWHWFPTHPHGDFEQVCPNCGEILKVKYRSRGVALSGKDFEIPELGGFTDEN